MIGQHVKQSLISQQHQMQEANLKYTKLQQALI